MRHTLILVAILALATLVRIHRIDLTWFFLDQVRDVTIASSIAAGKAMPLLGPYVGWTNGYLGPLYYYVIALPLLASRHPLAPVVFVVLANVLAIALLHRFAARWFGIRVALVASVLFAVFPLAVISSRILWNPALVPLWSVVFMRALFAVIVERHSRSIVWVLGALGVLTQLHLASVALAAVAVLAFAIWRPRVRPRDAVAGVALSIALYAPYLLHEFSHGFENTRALLSAGAGGEATGDRAFPALLANVAILSRPVLSGFGVSEPWSPLFMSVFSALYAVEAALFVLGVVLAVYKVLRSARSSVSERPLALLLLWVAVPVLMLGIRRTALWWYYLDLLYPGQFILIGTALSFVWSRASTVPGARRTVAVLCTGLIAGIVLSQVAFQIGLNNRVGRQGTIVLDVPKLSVSREGSSLGVLTSLPFGYRLGIVRALLDDFRVPEREVWRRVHGAVLGLPDESDYVLRYVGERLDHRSTDRVPSTAHYVVIAESSAGSRPAGVRSRRVGPYAIVERDPAIDYGSWSYAVLRRGDLDHIPAHGWTALALPAWNLGLVLRDGDTLVWQGLMRGAVAGASRRLAVSVIGEQRLQVIDVRRGGTPLSRVADDTRQTVRGSVPTGPSLYWTTETIFDAPAGAEAQAVSLVIAIGGHGRVLAVDVCEIGGP